MFHYKYKTENTCSQLVSLDLDENAVHNVSFMGGCNGNLKAIPILIDGWTVEEVEGKLTGILCGRRSTSCAIGWQKLSVRLMRQRNRHPEWERSRKWSI